jgi:methionyl-tRNA formyltransferase
MITNIRSNEKPGTVVMENESFVMMSTVDYYIVLYKDRFDELLSACETGNMELVSAICSVKEHINAQNNRGWSPLMVATYNNRKNVVKYLVSVGADIWQVNYNGTNLLMYAKETYKIYKDDYLFKLYKRLGLSEDMEDYNEHS